MAAHIVLMNKRRKRRAAKSRGKKKKYFPVVAHKRNPIRRKKRRSVKVKFMKRKYRRNPLVPTAGMVGRVINGQIIPAAVGAGGALTLSVAMGFLGGKLPPELNKPELRTAVKGAVAIGLGILAEQVISKSLAREATKGALTVVLHDAALAIMRKAAPTVALGEQFDMLTMGEQFPALGEQFSDGLPETQEFAGLHGLDGAPAFDHRRSVGY